MRAIKGKPDSRADRLEPKALEGRQELQRLAQFSPRHAENLHVVEAAESDARRERQLLGWCAQFSTEGERKLRKLLMESAEPHKGQRPGEQFTKALRESGSWDPSKHPRGGYPENRGWWSPTGGGSGGGTGSSGIRNFDKTGFDTSWANRSGSQVRSFDQGPAGDLFAGSPPTGSGKSGKVPQPAYDYLNPYGPASHRGTWQGEGTNRTLHLENPIKIKATGKVVREVKFIDNAPVLHVHDISDKTVTIILTGDSRTDIANAKAAWKRLHPGKELPDNAIFHHDLLHTRKVTVKLKGKMTQILVGRMPLIPNEIHTALPHQGSASVTERLYKALGVDVSAVKKLAHDRSKGGSIVSNVAKKMGHPRVPISLRSLVGRPIRLLIPMAGTLMGVIEFQRNAEAHGAMGAVARATPVLGDVIGAYDFGNDLAKQITDEANAGLRDDMVKLNSNAVKAAMQASEQTKAAFDELAQQIEVTNEYPGPRGLVDPAKVEKALTIFRNRMQEANYLKNEKSGSSDYEATEADAKRELRERLIEASQKDSPGAGRPAI